MANALARKQTMAAKQSTAHYRERSQAAAYSLQSRTETNRGVPVFYLHDPAVDGVVEVLGLEHCRFQDAVEVDDLIGVGDGGGGVSLLLRAHDAWRARPVAAFSSRAWLSFYSRLGKASKGRKKPRILAPDVAPFHHQYHVFMLFQQSQRQISH